MKVKVKRLKSLKIALKELEQFIKDGRHLKTGKPFKSMNALRSREMLGNWLLCVVGNFNHGKEDLIISSSPDEVGGDGLISSLSDETAFIVTEHVYVPPSEGAKVGDLVEAAVLKKAGKGGAAYAKGKSLVVFCEGGGQWWPNKVARAITGKHDFDEVWVFALKQHREEGTYAYNVALLDVRHGDAPVWNVDIDVDFERWAVARV